MFHDLRPVQPFVPDLADGRIIDFFRLSTGAHGGNGNRDEDDANAFHQRNLQRQSTDGPRLAKRDRITAGASLCLVRMCQNLAR